MSKMMKLGIVSTIVLLVLLFLALKAAKAAKYAKMSQSGSGTIGPDPATGTTTSNDQFPLKRGSRGPKVKAMQKGLNVLAITTNQKTIAEDSIFGPKTEELLFNTLGVKEVTKETYEKYAESTIGSWFSSLFNFNE